MTSRGKQQALQTNGNGGGRGAAAERALQQQKDLTSALRGTLIKRENAQAFAEMVPQTLGKTLTPERITKIVLGAASRNPKLLECTGSSVIKSVAELVGLGLEPGSPLGEGYLVPYFNGKIGALEAQAIPGYRGYLALARRSGLITKVVANIVYSRDRFDMDLTGFERPFHRLPEDRGDRGYVTDLYCVAALVNGEFQPEHMSKAEVEDVRKRSKSAQSGPWVTDWGQMSRKTVIRRASKYWPLSTEMASALELDNRNDGSVVDSTSPLQSSAPETMQSGGFGFSASKQLAPAGSELVVEHDPQTGEISPSDEELAIADAEAEKAAEQARAGA